MLQKLSDSWSLAKASARVLQQDKELLVLPVLSFLAALVVLASFALPIFLADAPLDNENSPIVWVLGFLFYLSQYFVIFFFNAALVGAALMRFRGEDPTLRDALGIAWSLALPLLGYAAIAATVGLLLRAIQERVGFIGRIITGLIGMAWTVATFLVVPVIVHRQVGPVDAISESTHLLKKTWGENLAGQAGIGLAFGALIIGVAFVSMGIMVMAAAISEALAIFVFVLSFLVMIGLGIYQAALSGVYQAALYRYADTGEMPNGFTSDQIQAAFVSK